MLSMKEKDFKIPTDKFINLKKPITRSCFSALLVVSAFAFSACGEKASVSETKKEPEKKVVKADATAKKSECGRVSIANMNWQSAEVLANIDKFILENGFGCTVELVAGDTVPTATSMAEKFKPDIAPELWTSAIIEVITPPIDEGRLVVAGDSLTDGGVEGWWIPKYTAEAHPEIKTVFDALEHPELFPDPENPDKGALYNCPTGWGCQISTTNLFKAFEAEAKGFRLVDTGSAAGLDGSIAKAYERNENWLGYYWEPTSLLGKYEMVKLDFGVPFSQEEWDRCTSVKTCTDPVPNAWGKSKVITLVTERVAKNNPAVMGYLKKRNWKNNVVNKLLAWMGENQADGSDGAIEFLNNSPDVWEKWLDSEQVTKVKAALQ